MNLSSLLQIGVLTIILVSSVPISGQGITNEDIPVDPGDPLFLTPLLESGQAERARELARVHNLTVLNSFSGYFTIDKKYGSNIFFWFFPAAFDPEHAPLLVWLNGGPGAATMFGLFVENGPIEVDSDGNIDYRATSWALSHSLLFFDNPVGAGFSFTEDEQGYVSTETDVTNGLYNALNQFYELFPEMKKRDLYLTGESYAGKYVPNLAARIHEDNLVLLDLNQSEDQVPLKGIAVGDGFTDPVSQIHFGNVLYNIGLVDRIGRKHFEVDENAMLNFIHKGKFSQGFEILDKLLGFTFGPTNNTFHNLTGLEQYYNLLLQTTPPYFNNHVKFLDKNNSTRKSLHVGSQTYNDTSIPVMRALRNDILQSCKGSVETLLNAKLYKILIYNGQLDLIVPPSAVNNFIRQLKWFGAESYANTAKAIWRVNGEVAGYKKSYVNFTHLLIRNSGHIVPYDQPQWALKMINEFIES